MTVSVAFAPLRSPLHPHSAALVCRAVVTGCEISLMVVDETVVSVAGVLLLVAVVVVWVVLLTVTVVLLTVDVIVVSVAEVTVSVVVVVHPPMYEACVPSHCLQI
jgi:hypothetical protein